MKLPKNLGIWMDHASANLMEFTANPAGNEAATTEFSHLEREASLAKTEHIMHNKEQNHQSEYYQKLGEVIRNYDEVILFGPTDAKVELFNTLKDDKHFANIKIDIKQADKMTENQQLAFVKDHFSK